MLSIVVIFFLLSISTWLIKYFAERELRQKNQEIEILRRRGSDFVANVSHELRTPLTSIKGYTETLRSVITKDPAKAMEFLSRIEENTERLSLLINDILELSRIEQPNFYLEKKSFKIAPLLDELRERFAFSLSSRKQILMVDNKADFLIGDRWLVDQALSN